MAYGGELGNRGGEGHDVASLLPCEVAHRSEFGALILRSLLNKGKQVHPRRTRRILPLGMKVNL